MGLPAGPVLQESHTGVKSHQDWEVEIPQIRSTVYYQDSQRKKKSFKDRPSFPEMFSGILSLQQCVMTMDL